MRGKLDLIYVDPPYDIKADYRTKISIMRACPQASPSLAFHRKNPYKPLFPKRKTF